MALVGIAGKIIAETLFALGRQAEAFSRKLTPRELKERFAEYKQPHYPDDSGVCLICHRRETKHDPRVLCPGTEAQQRARDELRKGDYELHR